MDRYGYAKKLSTGIVASVGTLGILLPPSVTLIVFGIITDQSIGRLFLAGIFPGLIIAFFFIVIIYVWASMYPAVAPRSKKFPWSERWRALPEVVWVVFIFALVIGGILKGFFTPTEAGSVGTFLVLVLTVLRRDLDLKKFFKAVGESLTTACMVLMLIAGSTVLGHFIAVTKIPMITATWITGLHMAPWIVMIFITFIYLIGGSFIDDLAFMILATPIFYPAIDKLGYNPLWFGIMIGVTVMVGVVIPPVAINVFVVKQITKTPFSVIYAGVYPFLISLVVAAALLFVFPGLATWLPGVADADGGQVTDGRQESNGYVRVLHKYKKRGSNMKRQTLINIGLLVFVVSIGLLLFPAVSSAQKVIALNFSNFFPAPHKNSILAEAWCREVEKRTNGKVKITYFAGGTLTPAAQTYDNVVKGIADIGESVLAYTRGKFPMMAVIDLPLGYRSGAQATGLINEYYNKFKPKELDEVKVLFLHAHGPGIVHTKKPVVQTRGPEGHEDKGPGDCGPYRRGPWRIACRHDDA